MHCHPAIAALRGDPAAQRRCLQAMTRAACEWQERVDVTRLREDLQRYGAGDRLDTCFVLGGLLSNLECARHFVDGWQRGFLKALRANPLGEVPFRYRQSGGFSTIQLLRSGRATLSLSAYERQNSAADVKTALLADRETRELVIEGEARGVTHSLEGEVGRQTIATAEATWRSGMRLATHATLARQITKVPRSLMILQLSRAPELPQPTREFDLATGRIVRTASGDQTASRDFLALGVLGVLDHSDGAEVMGKMARDTAREPDLRWEAVRQLLALDLAKGMQTLAAISDDPGDSLQGPAVRLKAQLVRQYRQLEQTQAA